MKTLEAFLEAKPLYYDEIDYTRMPRAYDAVRGRLRLPKIIHVVGTNGKGTTGRFLANALCAAGFDTGHYTSPHILRFNERIWRNGADCDDEMLETAHHLLYAMLGRERADALSYFEYTTLLAMVVYRDCDWVVLEAGLGGEHDATNVFAKEISLFTPIGMDHQAFLGDTIESIALTKLRSMGPRAIVGFQPQECVYGISETVAGERGSAVWRIQDILGADDIVRITRMAETQEVAEYLQQNLLLASAALRLVGIEPDEKLLDAPVLFGRLSRIGERITVDVGHNAMAAEALRRAVYPKKVILVYNSYRDKAYGEILRILAPIVQHVEIIEVNEARIEERTKIEAAAESAGLACSSFEGVRSEGEYLVFGSFSVVERFLRIYHEQQVHDNHT